MLVLSNDPSCSAEMISGPSRPTVLVVDDEPNVREFAATMLHRLGFHPLVVPDAFTALRLFERLRGQLHAVLLDMVMPAMSGEEALREMRAIDRRVPVIVSSGCSAKMVHARCGSERPDAFLQKPYRDSELLAVLTQAY